MLGGKDRGARRDIVLLNAAAALVVAEKVARFRQGWNLAAELIDNGTALDSVWNGLSRRRTGGRLRHARGPGQTTGLVHDSTGAVECARPLADTEGLSARAQAVLDHPDLFDSTHWRPIDFRFTTKRAFQFTSPVMSPWKRNNTVHGRLYTAEKPWQDKPTLILLHGWNAQTAYRTLFPHIARRLTKRGVNVAMFELPYHSRRKPRGKGAIKNFLSGDLVHVAQATHQAMADARALIAWLKEEGCPRVGLWGISLGAWLSGMLACTESRVDFAVLMTPVARLDRLIAEVDFCAPIRRSLGDTRVRLDSLNLATRRLKVSPDDILVVASEHDLFAPIATIEELWLAWNRPTLLRSRQGHISTLMSAPVMEKTVNWMSRAGLRVAFTHKTERLAISAPRSPGSVPIWGIIYLAHCAMYAHFVNISDNCNDKCN